MVKYLKYDTYSCFSNTGGEVRGFRPAASHHHAKTHLLLVMVMMMTMMMMMMMMMMLMLMITMIVLALMNMIANVLNLKIRVTFQYNHEYDPGDN